MDEKTLLQVERLLHMPDRTIYEYNWPTIAELVDSENTLTDEEKLCLLRKPTNLYKYAEKHPHMRTSNGQRCIFYNYDSRVKK